MFDNNYLKKIHSRKQSGSKLKKKMRKYHIIKNGEQNFKECKIYRDCLCICSKKFQCSFIGLNSLHTLCTFECLLCFYIFINRLQNNICVYRDCFKMAYGNLLSANNSRNCLIFCTKNPSRLSAQR